MRPEDITFRTMEAEVTDVRTGTKSQPMDVIEIRRPDGNVSAFPVDAVSPETGQTYGEMFGDKFNAFKRGDPDPDRVAQLEREIEQRQDELKAMREKPKDDARVQENLGYGKQPDLKSDKAAAITKDPNATEASLKKRGRKPKDAVAA